MTSLLGRARSGVRQRAPHLGFLYDRARGRTEVRDIDLAAAEVVARASPADLRDAERLERLIPHVGLHDVPVPDALTGFRGHGLRLFQLPNQFAPYLALLARHRIGSYVEIGLEHGGSFVLTATYLKALGNVLRHEVAVDLRYAPGVGRYVRRTPAAEQWLVDTRSSEFRARCRSLAPVGLVLIDGDHSYDGCLTDFETVHGYADLIAFHDIVDLEARDVARVWSEVQRRHADEYEFAEFIEQYRENDERHPGRPFFGIGVAVRRAPLRRQGEA